MTVHKGRKDQNGSCGLKKVSVYSGALKNREKKNLLEGYARLSDFLV